MIAFIIGFVAGFASCIGAVIYIILKDMPTEKRVMKTVNDYYNSIESITIDDITISEVFDKEGYHCDIELSDFEDYGNGCYAMTVTNLGISDKSIKQ